MATKGNRYLVADVCTLVQRHPGAPLWIAYDQRRCRFVADTVSRAGRARTQIGPYELMTSLWQIAQDVETAVADLQRLRSHAYGVEARFTPAFTRTGR